MTKQINGLFILAIVLVLLAACSGSQNNAGNAAEKYFQAIADGDENRIASVSCPDWESGARADVAAFVGVKARLDNVTCAPVSGSNDSDSGSVIVECSGAIVATYNNEDSNFELKGKQLNVINQNGEWLVCGYAQ